MIEEYIEKASEVMSGAPLSPKATTIRDDKSSNNQDVTSRGGV